LARLIALRLRIGKTQGIRFSSRPPSRAPPSARNSSEALASVLAPSPANGRPVIATSPLVAVKENPV